MSHDTHNTSDNKPGSSLTSSVWFMLILAFVFIAAVNFVDVMGHDDGGHGDAGHDDHATEHAAPAHPKGAHGVSDSEEHDPHH